MKQSRRPRYWLNLGLFSLGIVLIAIVVSVVYLSVRWTNNFIHPLARLPYGDDTPATYGSAYQDVRLVTSDGVELVAWYTLPQNGVVILAAHGYQSARSPSIHAMFVKHGYGVISWDARASGKSGGDTATFGFKEIEDVRAALKFVAAQDGVQHIGAFGQSAGAATLVHAAASIPEIEVLVADSPFATMEEEINVQFPIKIMSLLRLISQIELGINTETYRPIDDIRLLSPRPVFLIQGLADTIVLPDSAQRMYAVAGEPRQLWVEKGVGHIEMIDVYPQEYERRVFAFFDQYMQGKK